MALPVHLLHEPDPEHLDFLCAQLHPDICVTAGADVPHDIQLLIGGRPSRENLSTPHLNMLIIPFAGLPDTTHTLMAEFPHIAVHNLHYNAPMTAETATALLLAAAKRIVPVDRSFRRDDWTERYTGKPNVILDGKTILILGYGAIGQKVGHICRAMGMNVLAIRRHLDADSPEIYPPERLHDLLPHADVLMVCLPGTPETTGMIGAKELALLPQGAILVNVGRGAVVDEGAFYHALRDGNLYAAGVDVWYNYPTDPETRSSTPPSAYPFHELDNVVMSPHRAVGGGAREVERRRMSALASSLNAAARGEPVPHKVDLEVGY